MGVRYVDWQRAFLNGDAKVIVWAVHALPDLRQSLADVAQSLVGDEATFDERRLGEGLANRTSWVLPSAAFLLTSDIDPDRLARYLQ